MAHSMDKTIQPVRTSDGRALTTICCTLGSCAQAIQTLLACSLTAGVLHVPVTLSAAGDAPLWAA